jgi:hypothetical protein
MLLARFDAKVETLQINYPSHVSFRVTLGWTNDDAKPVYGYYKPKLYTVIVSPHLIRSVTLAYLALCKQAGRFL